MSRLLPVSIYGLGVLLWVSVARSNGVNNYVIFSWLVFSNGKYVILIALLLGAVMMSIGYAQVVRRIRDYGSPTTLLVLVLIGLAFLAAFALDWAILGSPYGDEKIFLEDARRLFSGYRPDQLSSPQPPLGKYILGSASLWTSTLPALRLPAVIAGVATLSMVSLTSWHYRKLAGFTFLILLIAGNAALIPALFLALSESFVSVFSIAGVIASLKILENRGLRWSAFSGLLFGLALATKWTVVPFIGITAVFLILRKLFRSLGVIALGIATVYLTVHLQTLLAVGFGPFILKQGAELQGLVLALISHVLAPVFVSPETSIQSQAMNFPTPLMLILRNLVGIDTTVASAPPWLPVIAVDSKLYLPQEVTNPGLWFSLWAIPAYLAIRGETQARYFSAAALAFGVTFGILYPVWAGYYRLAPFSLLASLTIAMYAGRRITLWLGWWIALEAGITWLI